MRARVLLVLAMLLLACRERPSDPGVAVLREAAHDVYKQRRGADTWEPAALGTSFRLGDAVRTGAGASARLELAVGGSVQLGADSLVRFEDRVAYRLTVGQAELAAQLQPLVLETAAGLARLEQGARVRGESDGEHVRLSVIVGIARFGGGEAAPSPMHAGEAIEVERSTGRVAEAPAPRPAEPQAAPADRRTDVIAGESPVVVEPRPPARLALRFDQLCPYDAIVELSGARLQGRGSVPLELGEGRHPYMVSCQGTRQRRARGTIVVRREAAAPPALAPQILDADGHKYRVVARAGLPLTFTWSGARRSGSYRLLVEPVRAGEPRSFLSRTPRKALAAGALAAGDYRFWFEAADGSGARSATSRLSLLRQ